MKILLADDDIDDCRFFKTALEELDLPTHLTIVSDGEQLMTYLTANALHLPDVLFLDLSMPRKTGFECLSEIKENAFLKDLVVVMFSTSFPRDKVYEENVISTLMNLGAYQFIRKPDDFAILKKVIYSTLMKISARNTINNLRIKHE